MIKMGRPRFRLEDVKIDDGGDSRIFGSLKLEKREFEYDDRTFYGMINKIRGKLHESICKCMADCLAYWECRCEHHHDCMCDDYDCLCEPLVDCPDNCQCFYG